MATAREDTLLNELAERVAYGLRQCPAFHGNAVAVRDAFDEMLDEALAK